MIEKSESTCVTKKSPTPTHRYYQAQILQVSFVQQDLNLKVNSTSISGLCLWEKRGKIAQKTTNYL